MEKRIIAVFTAFCLIMGGLCLRLYVLCSCGTELVSSESHYSSFVLYKIRGNITDCKGRKITETYYDNYVIAKPSDIIDSRTYQTVRKKMSDGSPVMLNIGKQELTSDSDILCVPIYKRYSDYQQAQHMLGYLDETGHGVTGIEKAFDSILFSDGEVKARVPADAYGRTISGSEIEITSDSVNVGSVDLTIDLEIQNVVEAALDDGKISEGCAIVIDIEDGALRAAASRPVYNANRVSDSLSSSAAPFLNRCFSSFAVGSIFKVVVATAALERGLDGFECECKGSCNVGGIVFGCSSNTAHGKVNLKKALEVSCNTYFINLGQRLGAEAITETAALLGFGQKNELADGIISDPGTVPTAEALGNPAALANFSFGQGSFTASPVQIAQMLCAVANKGIYFKPYIVKSVRDKDGKETVFENKYPVVALSEETSLKLTEMLTSVVENGNGSPAKPKDFFAAGKTATAQTGIFDKNGVELCNTWFGGFFPADNPRYAVVIMKQGGSSGAEDCAPVFKQIADSINLSE